MAQPKKNQSLISKLRNKYRLVILNDDTFEEKLSFKLSRLNVFLGLGLLTILLIGGTALIIAFTPLREYIPGYSSTKLRRQAYLLSQVTDSLSQQLNYNQVYLTNIQRILNGEPLLSAIDSSAEIVPEQDSLSMIAGHADSAFREMVEEEERFSLSTTQSLRSPVLSFFTPLKGIITQGFKPEENHLGVDVVARENAVIKSAQEGMVLFAEWTSETGYVIIVQHPENFISVYKHNSALLKSQGEKVKTGEPLAIVGNSGHLSSGPHLHFELWHDGFPVNPESYLFF